MQHPNLRNKQIVQREPHSTHQEIGQQSSGNHIQQDLLMYHMLRALARLSVREPAVLHAAFDNVWAELDQYDAKARVGGSGVKQVSATHLEMFGFRFMFI